MYKGLVLLMLWAAPTALGAAPAMFGAAPAARRAQGPADAQGDDAAIRHVLSDQVIAWNNGDVTAFMQGYWQNDSLTFIGKNGPQYGWQPVLDHYKKVYPDKAAMGTLTFSHLILKRLSPDYYFVIGAWHLDRAKGPIGGHFTLLFHKIEDKWKIVVDHTS